MFNKLNEINAIFCLMWFFLWNACLIFEMRGTLAPYIYRHDNEWQGTLLEFSKPKNQVQSMIVTGIDR